VANLSRCLDGCMLAPARVEAGFMRSEGSPPRAQAAGRIMREGMLGRMSDDGLHFFGLLAAGSTLIFGG